MKLRNKKTGKVFNIAFCSNYMEEKIVIGVEIETDPVFPKCNFCDYKSLKELCEEWEDCEPKEPAEPTKDQDTIDWLKSENSYLRGKVYAYEKFLKDKGEQEE